MQGQTIVSAKGQIVLPKAARDRKGWGIGQRLDVIDVPGGLFLRELPDARPRSTTEDVFERLRKIATPGQALASDDEAMRQAIADAVRRDEATRTR
jgi:AbrB family looped-hinge helix DNA binding protein